VPKASTSTPQLNQLRSGDRTLNCPGLLAVEYIVDVQGQKTRCKAQIEVKVGHSKDEVKSIVAPSAKRTSAGACRNYGLTWLRPEPAKMAAFIIGPDSGRRDCCVIGVVAANISAATGMVWIASSTKLNAYNRITLPPLRSWEPLQAPPQN
jgi:hypothetical protein